MCPAGSIQSFGLLQEPEACLAVDFQHAGHLLQLALVGRQKLDFEGYRLHPTSPPVCLNYSTAGRINQAAIPPRIEIRGFLAAVSVIEARLVRGKMEVKFLRGRVPKLDKAMERIDAQWNPRRGTWVLPPFVRVHHLEALGYGEVKADKAVLERESRI